MSYLHLHMFIKNVRFPNYLFIIKYSIIGYNGISCMEAVLSCYSFFPSSQNATALAAATLRESTPWVMGILTV